MVDQVDLAGRPIAVGSPVFVDGNVRCVSSVTVDGHGVVQSFEIEQVGEGETVGQVPKCSATFETPADDDLRLMFDYMRTTPDRSFRIAISTVDMGIFWDARSWQPQVYKWRLLRNDPAGSVAVCEGRLDEWPIIDTAPSGTPLGDAWHARHPRR